MNVKRFVGKNAREAMAQARAAYGDQTVVLSNRPVPGGVEILAMASAEVADTTMRLSAPAKSASLSARAAERASERAAVVNGTDDEPMSTLSFQSFVRERQKQDAMAAEHQQRAADIRAEELAIEQMEAEAAARRLAVARNTQPRRPVPPTEPARFAAQEIEREMAREAARDVQQAKSNEPRLQSSYEPRAAAPAKVAAPVAKPVQAQPAMQAVQAAPVAAVAIDNSPDLLAEIKALRSTLTQQLATMTWFDSVRRSPAQTHMLRLLIGNGFSPALARQLVQKVDPQFDAPRAEQWLVDVLARNLRCTDSDTIQAKGGVFALVGPTGVGKTTTTAKIAANFAREHGANSVGLITVDTYRMAASDQLRGFGSLLNIPVHTARDAASLADLLDLFNQKKLVLIDTVGVGQRDRRIADLFAALPARRVQRLLVLNAAAQGEALDEVVQAYSSGPGTRCVISKLDEAVKCGAAIDVALRHQLQIEGIANGQRVPEDWHAARAPLLAQKALMKLGASAYVPDDTELGLMMTAPESMNLQGAGNA